MPFLFDKKSRRFRDEASGKFVSRESVRKAVTDTTTGFRSKASKLADRLENKQITVTQWKNQMASLVKENITATASIGKGGWRQMTKADWGRAGATIKKEYAYLQNFADAVSSGRLSPLQINARARLYADAGHVAFSEYLTATHLEGGFTEAKRTLHAKETCSGCRPLAGRWMPIDEMPEIGGVAPCGVRCRCELEFR